MNIPFAPFLKNYFNFIYRPEKIYLNLSVQQKTILKIAIAIFSAFSAIYLCLKLDSLRRRVTVIETDDSCYSTQIGEVTGHFKVIFNGYFASQATAEGEFIDGQLNGQGKIIFPYGDILEEKGEFLKGWLMDGKIIYRDGKKEKGEFNKGVLHGQGIRIYSDKKVEKGHFKNGKLIDSSS